MRLILAASKATLNPADTVLALPKLNSAALLIWRNANGKTNPTSCSVSENETGRSILALLSSDGMNRGIGVCEAVIDVVRVLLRIDHLCRCFEHWVGSRYATTYREAKGGESK